MLGPFCGLDNVLRLIWPYFGIRYDCGMVLFCLAPSHWQSGPVCCWCSVKLFMPNRRLSCGCQASSLSSGAAFCFVDTQTYLCSLNPTICPEACHSDRSLVCLRWPVRASCFHLLTAWSARSGFLASPLCSQIPSSTSVVGGSRVCF